MYWQNIYTHYTVTEISLVTPGVAKMTTFSATSGENFINFSDEIFGSEYVIQLMLYLIPTNTISHIAPRAAKSRYNTGQYNTILNSTWHRKSAAYRADLELKIDTAYISHLYQQTIGASRWRHQMERFSALLALCVGNSPVTGEFPAQRPVTRSFDVFFDLRLNKRLSKQSWGWWFETPSRSLWRHRNVLKVICWYCGLSLLAMQFTLNISQTHGSLWAWAQWMGWGVTM